MNFGILGCRHGHIEIFIQEMLDLGHVPVGIYEPEPKLAQVFSDKYGIPMLKSKEALYSCNPEVIGTSAINNQKIAVIEDCSSLGIHVMADKPVITSRSGLERLHKVINDGRIEVGMLLTERFVPPVYTLNKLIRQGVLGQLISFTTIKPHRLAESTRDSWHFSEEENGGILIDLLIHDFDLLFWFTGSNIKSCTGFMRRSANPRYSDFYDNVQVLAEMENGVTASLGADWFTPDGYWTWGDGRIFCTGTEGRVEIRATGDSLIAKEALGILVTNDRAAELIQWETPPSTITEDFLNRIHGREDIILSHGDILKASEATVLANEQIKRI